MRRRYAALDSVVSVRAPEAVLADLDALLAGGAGESEATAEVVVSPSLVVSGAGPGDGVQARDRSHAVELVLALLNAVALEQCVDLAVHAGVVVRSGRAVAVPAVSGAGKSTLVAACVRTGWQYASDEALVLADDGAVRPYARPLTLLSWTLLRLDLAPPPTGATQRPVPVIELGGTAVTGPTRLSDVVLLDRRPGRARLAPVSPAAAAMELLRHAFNHYRDPERSVRVAASAVRACAAWRLSYDDPLEAAQLLTQVLEG